MSESTGLDACRDSVGRVITSFGRRRRWLKKEERSLLTRRQVG